jgi:hypothetical protein
MSDAVAPHISLEQWRALIAVVDGGGYAQAAAAIHKSQSAVTYAVQKLEAILGVGYRVRSHRRTQFRQNAEAATCKDNLQVHSGGGRATIRHSRIVKNPMQEPFAGRTRVA